jgi:protein subunit release factor B
MRVPEQLRINSQLAIPRRELKFTFVRSSGPGGQNVNKVASKAVLRWDVARSGSLPAQVRGQYRTQMKAAESWELALSEVIQLWSRAKNAILKLFQKRFQAASRAH